MFLGSFKYSIDSKGRVSLPAKLRKSVNPASNDTFVLTRSLEKCIEIHPKDKWEENIEAKLNMLNSFNKNHSAFLRMYLEKASEDTLDSQSRLSIPQNLKDYAGIKKEVMIIGMNKNIEVWDPEEYERYISRQDLTFEELANDVMNDK